MNQGIGVEQRSDTLVGPGATITRSERREQLEAILEEEEIGAHGRAYQVVANADLHNEYRRAKEQAVMTGRAITDLWTRVKLRTHTTTTEAEVEKSRTQAQAYQAKLEGIKEHFWDLREQADNSDMELLEHYDRVVLGRDLAQAEIAHLGSDIGAATEYVKRRSEFATDDETIQAMLSGAAESGVHYDTETLESFRGKTTTEIRREAMAASRDLARQKQYKQGLDVKVVALTQDRKRYMTKKGEIDGWINEVTRDIAVSEEELSNVYKELNLEAPLTQMVEAKDGAARTISMYVKRRVETEQANDNLRAGLSGTLGDRIGRAIKEVYKSHPQRVDSRGARHIKELNGYFADKSKQAEASIQEMQQMPLI